MIDRAARLACIALIVAVLVGGAGATGSPVSAQRTDTIADTQIDPDDVSITVALREDGSAAWTIEYRTRLDNENITDAFLSLQDDIEANESQYTADFRQRIESTVSAAENATGRNMTVRNVSVEASRQQLPQDYGVIAYTFVWTNFATVDGGTIRAGDALAGFFIDSETSLQFTWPAGYGLETVQPEPDQVREDSRVVVWNGPLDFSQDEPTVVVSQQAAGGTTTTAPGGEDGGDGDEGGDGGAEGGGLPIGALVVLLLAVGIVGWVLYRRRGAGEKPTIGAPDAGGAGATQGGDAGAAGGGGESAASSGSDRGAGDAGESVAAGSGAAAASGSADDAETAGTDEGSGEDESTAEESGSDEGDAADDQAPWEDELLSNQEQVLALVEHEGGRMKQQEVAQRLEWTDAKTSQVVRKMREEDELDAFRLGRENVLVLPDEEFGPGDATEE